MKKSLAYDSLTLLPTDFQSVKLIDDGIPKTPPNNTVTIHRNKLTDFRNRYAILAEFAAEVLKNKDFCVLDIVRYYNHENPNEHEKRKGE